MPRAPTPGEDVHHADGLSHAIEFAATPVLFGALGWWLDRTLGLAPVLTIALGAFALVATSVAFLARYQAAMAREEQGKPWTRRRR